MLYNIDVYAPTGLPAAVRSDVRPLPGTDSDDTSSVEGEYHVSPSTSVHQSSVEVHETPRLHRHTPHQAATNYTLFGASPSNDAAEKISVGSQTSGSFQGFGQPDSGSDSSSYSSIEGNDGLERIQEPLEQVGHGKSTPEEQQLGAVGGHGNLAFELVEDHFDLESGRRKKRWSPNLTVRVVGKGNIQEEDEEDRLPPV